jgi:Cu/Zn superoxide dismutase
LTALLDLDGASLVVYERADDNKTDPSGTPGDASHAA